MFFKHNFSMAINFIDDATILQNELTIKNLLAEAVPQFNVYEKLKNTDYFIAPASKNTHLACDGGLAQHGLNLRNELIYQNNRRPFFNERELVTIPIGHDLCKYNFYGLNPLYGLPNEEKYIIIDKEPTGHGSKSLERAVQLIPDLNPREKVCIRWHWMYFDYEFKKYSNRILKEFPELWLVYTADNFAANFAEQDHGDKFRNEHFYPGG